MSCSENTYKNVGLPTDFMSIIKRQLDNGEFEIEQKEEYTKIKCILKLERDIEKDTKMKYGKGFDIFNTYNKKILISFIKQKEGESLIILDDKQVYYCQYYQGKLIALDSKVDLECLLYYFRKKLQNTRKVMYV